MIGTRLEYAAVGRFRANAMRVALLLALAACDQFDTGKIIDSCVTSAMKHGEPYGNARERAQAQAQFRVYCTKAAGGKSP